MAQCFYFDTQVGGGKINWPGQLTPTPATKHTEQSDKENS